MKLQQQDIRFTISRNNDLPSLAACYWHVQKSLQTLPMNGKSNQQYMRPRNVQT